ncbi:MAG: Na+/H+ antiporter NhaC [Anaeromicrobium sp.]|jgi:NhaC family Na+:H+ antiporter|uniref:Na+/H+ antiporter NhaC n=1 Tax=Anaeromicrobium sp. TaxID=1929132 RepID=UPI0025F4D676|nr:Na+/H+ antiporter NhaC [Anaeromicrobium sp.]MCT4593300.1 Na+/H+ antiporter NhaC [Anaeromicrobium sp.]
MTNEVKRPSFGASLSTFLGVVGILVIGILAFKMDIHILLSLGLIYTCFMAKSAGFTLDEIFDGMADSVKKAMVAMLIFILIGTIIGSWISAGTVPALIYYGLKFLNPKFFLPAGFIVCCITSFATGTSWGTAGTVGLAMMGMGMGLGIPAPAIAGMVISGAAFGDKMSPMSDTTILAAASAECDMYDHIKAMSYTTIPATLISLAGFTFLGFKYTASSNMTSQDVVILQETLEKTFNLNPIVLLPILVVIVLSLMKVPSVPALTIGTFLGSATAVIFQKVSIVSAMDALNYGYTQATGIAIVDKLLLRGGIQGMMWTFSLAFIALCLGGVLEKAEFLTVLIEKILLNVKSNAGLMLVTMISTIVGCAATSEVYLAIILNGSLFKDAYTDKGLRRSLLSRILEEGSTLVGPIIPWTTCGAFMAGTLGVDTLKLAPFALLCWINPLISIVLGYMGIFVPKEDNVAKKVA